MTRFSAEPVLAQLKDFQRDTCDYVFERMYEERNPSKRFLVADEVGLGKTLVARGVIARAIEHLQDEVDRIDVVYVCSNAQIARQNVRRLSMPGFPEAEVADRITLLPATLHRFDPRLNFVSFTPGTSFELKGGGGTARERAMLRLMLSRIWPKPVMRSRGSMRVFQGGVRDLETFRRRYRKTARQYGRSLDEALVENFRRAVSAHDSEGHAGDERSLLGRFEELCEVYGHDRPVSGWTRPERQLKNRFVGDVRDLMARACLDALEPDIIVLDEFQRFKSLLAEPGSEDFGPAAELAHQLFDYTDEAAGTDARVLLLSATPYKMHTTVEADEHHHDDLVETTRFLLGEGSAGAQRLREDLRDLRHGLEQVGRDGGRAASAAKRRVEETLTRVMVRTERLAATADRSGMLADRCCAGVHLTPDEILSFVEDARLARHLDVQDPLEFWKSAPYLHNFMDDYVMKTRLVEEAAAPNRGLVDRLAKTSLLPFDDIEAFEGIDPSNARMRWLVDDIMESGAWKLLWVPPSLPYTEPAGPFAEDAADQLTKRLIFSSWTVVPKTISTMLTYEAERRMVTAGGTAPYRNTVDDRASRGGLLDFRLSGDRLAGMPVLNLVYPNMVLADEGDPAALSRARDGHLVGIAEAIEAVSARLAARIDDLVGDLADSGATMPASGAADEAWYWLAPLLLDRFHNESAAADLLGRPRRFVREMTVGDPRGGGDRLVDHLRFARDHLSDLDELGRMPDDLADVLARVALASPAVVSLRALGRISGRELTDRTLRGAAANVAWGLRSLFNLPEVTELVRGLAPSDDPYWQRVLDYSLAGNLQSVLDEWAHVLVSDRGHLDAVDDDALLDIAHSMSSAVSLRAVNYGVSRIDTDGDRVSIEPARLRARFSLRLSDERSAEGDQIRVSEVRDSFNSPFRPFVLATTSAGQEGLDFHPYCHAVVHWNLPGNPVDLEQREGRIHRFKGHAVRRNIAADFGVVGRKAFGDPWETMFEAARAERAEGLNDIIPFWVYSPRNGNPGFCIERYVPALPLSRDVSRSEELQRRVALYRLAFGQPRQDDLLAYLEGEIGADKLAEIADDLRVDLSPRRTRRTIGSRRAETLDAGLSAEQHVCGREG